MTALISVVHWAIGKARRYTAFASKVDIIVPEKAYCNVIYSEDSNLRLRAMLVDLAQYRIAWVEDGNPWAPSEGLTMAETWHG